MNNIRKMGAILGAGAAIFSIAGCADKNGNGQAESPAAANNVGGAIADNLGDTANAASGAVGGVVNGVSNAGETVANVASNAGENIAEGANKMGGAIVNAGEAATMTPKVKADIAANAGLKGTKINVDTLGSKDSIALRGSVNSEAQKKLAESVAKKAAPGYKIINQLTMAGKM